MYFPDVRLPVLAVLFLAPVVVCADIVHLKDGTKLEGDVKKSRDGWYVTDAKGKATTVPAEKVKSIELKSSPGPGAPADAAAERLFSLRRSVENVASVQDVIDRYLRFIEQNPGTESAREAEKELAVWVDRKARGLVKLNNQWVTPEEMTALRDQSFAVASEARELIKDGRVKEAEAILAKALAVDPRNASAQYLKGVLDYRAGRVPAARRAFEAVDQQVPNHAPTLNNLGVVLWRQNQHAAALGMYERAMVTAPLDRDILNNVAEALYGLPEDTRKAAVIQRVSRRFIEQDEQLQQEMAKVGQYRWGSTWVDQAKLDELKGAEEKVKARLDELAAEFDAAQQRIQTIDQDIDANTREMRRLEARTYTSLNGRTVRAELPSRYNDLQDDNAKLASEREQQVKKQQQLRAGAKDVQKMLPTPKYSGTQKLIETEGTPAVFPGDPSAVDDPAASMPATAPATTRAAS